MAQGSSCPRLGAFQGEKNTKQNDGLLETTTMIQNLACLENKIKTQCDISACDAGDDKLWETDRNILCTAMITEAKRLKAVLEEVDAVEKENSKMNETLEELTEKCKRW